MEDPSTRMANLSILGTAVFFTALNATIGGQSPLGVQVTGPINGTQLFYYSQATAESTVFTGSMSDVMGRYNAANTAAADINGAGFKYFLLGISPDMFWNARMATDGLSGSGGASAKTSIRALVPISGTC
jgi:hypothetical protein